MFSFLKKRHRTPEESGRIHRAEVAAQKHRQLAIRANEIAGQIRSEADAQDLVARVMEVFAEELPKPFTTSDLLHRLARAEYKAATDTRFLIPEDKFVCVWNEYIRTIGASDEAFVTTSELHSLRDLNYASAMMNWSHGNQNIWTVPNIYAVPQDGKVLTGARAMEALMVSYELGRLFENLRTARKLVIEGIVGSDQIHEAEERRRSLRVRGVRTEVRARLEVRTSDNPVRNAEQRYISQHGTAALYTLLSRLVTELLTESR